MVTGTVEAGGTQTSLENAPIDDAYLSAPNSSPFDALKPVCVIPAVFASALYPSPHLFQAQSQNSHALRIYLTE